MERKNRYLEWEKQMIKILVGIAGLFVLYLVFAIAGIIWLKVILSILTILSSALILALLYLNGEFTKRRSQWMSVSAAALFFCTIVSLLSGCP
jgi:hypothetical protein